jgi:hypothetical protein
LIVYRRNGASWTEAIRIDATGTLITGHIHPTADGLYDIGGGTSAEYRNGYFSSVVFSTVSRAYQAAQRYQDLGNRTGVFNINFNLGATVRMRLTGNVTLQSTGGTLNEGVEYILEITQDGTGGRTTTFNLGASIVWEGGVAYSSAGAAIDQKDEVRLRYNGTVFYGSFRTAFA